MKKWSKLLSVFALAGALTVGVTFAGGCHKKPIDGDINNGDNGNLDVEVNKITVTAGSNKMTVGATMTVTAVITPSNATNKAITWSSSDTEVATVSEGGVVTAKKAGTVTITAKSVNDIAGVLNITVSEEGETPPVESIEISFDLNGHGTGTIEKATAVDGKITAPQAPKDDDYDFGGWAKTADGTTAVDFTTETFTQSGTLYAIWTAKKVTPPDTKPVTGFTLSETTKSLKMGETETFTLTVSNILPADTTDDKTVTWKSSDESVATVVNGVVTAKKAGTVTITAKVGTIEKTCAVTIGAAAENPPVVDPNPPADKKEKLSEQDFTSAINATIAAEKYSAKTQAGVLYTVDSTAKAVAEAGGKYYVYDATAQALCEYRPIANIAWEKAATEYSGSTFEAAYKAYINEKYSLYSALEGFAAGYSSLTFDEASGEYALNGSKVTIEDGKVATFGNAKVTIEITDYGTASVAEEFTPAFENVVMTKIAANEAAGTKLTAKGDNSTFGLYADAEMATETDYVEATANGYAQKLTKTTSNNKGTHIWFGNLEGKIEGYFEFTPTAMGSKWDMISVRSGGNKILTLRTGDNSKSLDFRKKLGEDSTNTSAFAGVTPAANTLYKVKYAFEKDATSGNYKATIEINGNKFVENEDLGVAVLDGIHLGTSGAGSDASKARYITVNNVIICGTVKEGSYTPVTEVKISAEAITLEEGGSETLTVTVLPENATDKAVVWSTSDESVAEVDQKGVVRAKKAGTAVISAVTASGKTAQSTVTVASKPKPKYTVTFISEGKTEDTQTVEEGSKAIQPKGLTREGYTLTGWSTSATKEEPYDFTTAVTGNLTLYAIWVEGTAPVDPNPPVVDPNPPVEPDIPVIEDANFTHIYAANETAVFEWDDTNITKSKVEYKLATEAEYKPVDKHLIRQIDRDTGRVDILGLKGNATYDFRITTSAGQELVKAGVKVSALDRSGYAHFNYTDGVGAYNDDGTLKDNALVIYVTNENKDTVMKEVCAANPDVPMFKIPGNDWGNKDAEGIGWWLNNNQYTTSNAGSKKNKAPSNTYDQTNGGKLSFKSVNRPIVVRFIGTVETPEGCTAYNSVNEGGGVGDNGHMARLKNLKNVTLEGVGEDAVIKGWGFHFVIGTDATNGQGTSFEVRNLTFSEYPEDAIGMEGQQAGGKITASVERCWIHHNKFLPGHCENPAESDKAEGDGSCDFKRGQYFTCSYNWFEYCHKTNLVGSADDSLQYNLTYHHNVWWQCGSRIPLTRQANVHFYNNYVYGNQGETTTPYSWISKPALSYVHSLRANCYIFTEFNYYDGMKAVTDGKNGGSAKGWGNTYYACFGTNTIEDATTREQEVANNCAYNGTSYKKFDTDPNLFYYDAINKKSNCYLTDATRARKECLLYSGVQKHSYDINTNLLSEKDKPAQALSVGADGLTIDLTKAAVGATVDGVKFIDAKNNSGTAKGGKTGPLLAFTLAERTDISVTSATAGETACELLRDDGTLIAGKFSVYTGTLEAGTYLITGGTKAKEASLSSLSFKCGVSDAEKVQTVIGYIDAIGTVEFTEDCKARIDMAQTSYNALSPTLKAQVTNANKLTAAVNTYNEASVAPVVELISAIGTVTANSGTKITAARTAYDKLNAAQKALVSNYEVLVAAEKSYEAFEVEGINIAIAALAAPETATTEEEISALLDEYLSVQLMYQDLDEEQRDLVVGYANVTAGIASLQAAAKPYAVRDMIAALPEKADVTLADSAKINAARAGYNALDEAGKTIVGDITKLTQAEEAFSKLASESKVAIFQKSKPELASNAGFTVSGTYKGTSDIFEYNGQEYNAPLKMESSTSVTFTTAAKMKITICLHTGAKSQKIMVDGTSYTATDGIIEFELAAGDHTITRDGEAWLCYIVLSPIA